MNNRSAFLVGTTISLAPAIIGFLIAAPAAADNLPPESAYVGKIRRDEDGRLVAVPQAASASKPTSARTIRVGPAQAIRSISDAAKMAKDGDTIEIDASDYFADVAVWKQTNLTLRGVGGPGQPVRLIAAGASAEGKAIWVMRGGNITVENIEFTGARVPDKNGAGIRFEKGHLTVRNCRFLDNENGILTGGGDTELDLPNGGIAYVIGNIIEQSGTTENSNIVSFGAEDMMQ